MHKKDKSTNAEQQEKVCPKIAIKIQRTYLLYTPKIIKFIYNTEQQDRLAPILSSLNKKQSSQFSSFHQIAPKQPKDNTVHQSRSTKIKLVSRKKTQSNQNSNKSMIEFSSKTLKKGRKLTTYCSSQKMKEIKKNYIQADSLLNCSMFERCFEGGQYDQFNHQSFQTKKVQSRAIIIQQQQPVQTIKRVEKMSQLHHQRKKIFDCSNLTKSYLNKSVNYQSRSKSRKSIFQHYSIHNKSRSFSQNLSPFRKNRIFQPKQKPFRRQTYELIKEQDIPQLILQNWKQKERSTGISIGHIQAQIDAE